MSRDFVPEPAARTHRRTTPARLPLDRMTADDVDDIVDRVVQMRLDQARITAAKFSSFI